MLQQPEIIAIGGPTCSGKTTLAQAVASLLDPERTTLLSLDAYYHDLAHLAPEVRARQNFDAPDALDWPLLLKHLALLREGNTVAVPDYDFTAHTRRATSHCLQPSPWIIVEGLYALYDPAVREMCRVTVFVGIGPERALQRRIERDTVERGRTEASVRDQYASTVHPMCKAHVLPTRRHAHLVVSGTAPPEENARRIANLLNK